MNSDGVDLSFFSIKVQCEAKLEFMEGGRGGGWGPKLKKKSSMGMWVKILKTLPRTWGLQIFLGVKTSRRKCALSNSCSHYKNQQF